MDSFLRHRTAWQLGLATASGIAAAIALMLVGATGGLLGAATIVSGAKPSWTALQVGITVVSIGLLAVMGWAVYRATNALWAAALVVVIGGGSNLALVLFIVLGR